MGRLVTLPVVLNDHPHVSVSTIEAYITCPRKVWLEKFAPKDQRVPFVPTGALVAGSAAHAPVEKAVETRNKLRAYRWPDDWESITRNARKWYDAEFNLRERQDRIEWQPGERSKVYDGGWAAAQTLLAGCKDLDIVTVEEEFALPLRGRWSIKGRKDARLRDGNLIDLKTESATPSAEWRWTQQKADESLQAAIYVADEYAKTGVLPSLTFLVARKRPNSKLRVFPTTPNHVRVHMALGIAKLMTILIEHGIFPRRPGGCWGCPLQGGCQ